MFVGGPFCRPCYFSRVWLLVANSVRGLVLPKLLILKLKSPDESFAILFAIFVFCLTFMSLKVKAA